MSKIAFVTGGSRGLGKEMALRIADKGLDVVLTYKSSKDEAAKVVRAIEAKDRQAFAVQLDTSDIASFDAAVQEVKTMLKAKMGTEAIDFLVNNAGIGLTNSIAETTEEQFDTLSNIHLKGVFFLTQKLIPMLNAGGGIINVSSGLARFSMPGYAAYAMMKGGIEVFSRYLAKELGSRRQFLTRDRSNHEILSRFEKVLDRYFKSDALLDKGLPTVQYLSEQLHISSDYLSSTLRHATGQNARQHIHNKIIDRAKEKLSNTTLSVSEVAYALGFEHSQSFSKLFKQKTNQTPLEFRKSFYPN